MKKSFNYLFTLLMLLTGFCCMATAASKGKKAKLAEGFIHPQDSARTKVWWFFGETETTREGITADLEAYKAKGVGGVVYYDQVHGDGAGASNIFDPEWWDMLVFASQEAKRLGVDFEINVGNGYVAGGKWITPENSMQRLAVTKQVVNGGTDLKFRLQAPRAPRGYKKEVAVLAVPYSDDLMNTSEWAAPDVTCNVEGVDIEKLFQEGGSHKFDNPDSPVYINMVFDQPFTARSISYFCGGRGKARTSAMPVPGDPADEFFGMGYRTLPVIGQLEVSDDGQTYRRVCDLRPKYQNLGGVKQQTVSFPAVKGRYFRLNLHNWSTEDKRDRVLTIGEIGLSAAAAPDRWEEKASLVPEFIEGDQTPIYNKVEVIDPATIIDLTDKMDKNGNVTWAAAPAGKWLVMRFCSISTGARTKHGRKEALGLECDKLSVRGANQQWECYVKPVIDRIRQAGGALSGVAMDSHEAGPQNWTPGFEQEFQQLQGYDIKPYLPVLAGYVVGSTKESDGFLHDFRCVISELVASRYFGRFNELCRAEGLTLTAQAVGGAVDLGGDQISVKRFVDKPQGEFWAYQREGNYDIKDCASAAHIYGKQIASGEAYTDARYSNSLFDIKNLADYAFAFGMNEFVVCASAYQPRLDRFPGNTANGRQYCLNRNNTLWEMSSPFWDYQARGCYMMRQGKPVSDFCLYLGEDAPLRTLPHKLPVMPKGYDFDSFTTDALINRMTVKDGRIVLPDGVSYSMMLLSRDAELSLKALKKIAELVNGGAKVWGPRPQRTVSHHDVGHEAEFQQLVNALWGATPTDEGQTTYGKGRVLWGGTLQAATTTVGMQPDVVLPADTKCLFAHRQTDLEDIYFLNNRHGKGIDHNFVFRSEHRVAELWNIATGKRYLLEGKETPDGRIRVRIKLAAYESCFVVLADKKSGSIDPYELNVKEWGKKLNEDDWTIDFDKKLGGPGRVTVKKLTDWTSSDEPGIKYYSGTAVYRHKFTWDRLKDEASYLVQFPRLNSMAEVIINGKSVGIVWCSPWNVDITKYIREGSNTLELRVVNTLYNRMIGDCSLPESERITWSSTPLVREGQKPLPSGIVGEMMVVEVRPLE